MENTPSALGQKSGENASSSDYSAEKDSLINREKYEGGRLFDMIVETAIKLKLFVVSGKTEDGQEVYIPSPVFAEKLSASSQAGLVGGTSSMAGLAGGDSPDAFSSESSFAASSSDPSYKKGLININAGTIITVMPGFSLKELLPLSVFMEASKCSTVTEFDITRKSASRSFDLNYSPEKIF